MSTNSAKFCIIPLTVTGISERNNPITFDDVILTLTLVDPIGIPVVINLEKPARNNKWMFDRYDWIFMRIRQHVSVILPSQFWPHPVYVGSQLPKHCESVKTLKNLACALNPR